jgi:hypothetical protein
MVFLGTVVIEIPGGRADTHPRAKAVIRYRLTLCREGTASYEPLAEKYVLLEPGVRIRDVPIVIDAGRPVRTAACETEAR